MGLFFSLEIRVPFKNFLRYLSNNFKTAENIHVCIYIWILSVYLVFIDIHVFLSSGVVVFLWYLQYISLLWNIEPEEVSFWNDADYILHVLNSIRGHIYICFNLLWNSGCEFLFSSEKATLNAIIFVHTGTCINRSI